jgi:drug/metabolite transporter (DMT)-like permease
MVFGMLLAFTASALFNVAVAVQALDARTLGADHSLRLSLLRQLVRRSRWRFGMLLALAGWPFHAAALLLAPLTAVQPALAAGLLILLFVSARVLHEPVGRRELVGVLAIIAGEAGLAWAAPHRSSSHTHGAGLIVAILALAAVALLPYAYRARRGAHGLPTIMSAGVAFALSGFVTKLVSDDLSSGALFSAWLWADLVGLAAVVGVLSENTALQSRPASQVAPLVFSAQTVLPVLLAPLLAGEHWGGTPLGGWAVAIALAVVIAGVLLLATSHAVDALIGGRATALAPEPKGEAA